MAMPTPANARTEIRLDQKGRLAAYFDGVRIPGVTNINVSHYPHERTVVDIQIIGCAVRLATEESEAA